MKRETGKRKRLPVIFIPRKREVRYGKNEIIRIQQSYQIAQFQYLRRMLRQDRA